MIMPMNGPASPEQMLAPYVPLSVSGALRRRRHESRKLPPSPGSYGATSPPSPGSFGGTIRRTKGAAPHVGGERLRVSEKRRRAAALSRTRDWRNVFRPA